MDSQAFSSMPFTMDSLQPDQDSQNGQNQLVKSSEAQNISDALDSLESSQLLMINNQREAIEKIDYLIESRATALQLEQLRQEFVPTFIEQSEVNENLSSELHRVKQAVNRHGRQMNRHGRQMNGLETTAARIEDHVRPATADQDATGPGVGDLFILFLGLAVAITSYIISNYVDMTRILGAIIAFFIALFVAGWYNSRF